MKAIFKSIFLALVLVSLPSCLGKSSLKEVSREMRLGVNEIENELREIRFLSLRRDVRGNLKIAIEILDTSVSAAIKDLRKPATDGINLSKLLALKSELSIVQEELNRCDLIEKKLTGVKSRLQELMTYLDHAISQIPQGSLSKKQFDHRYRDYFEKGLVRENARLQLFQKAYRELEKGGLFRSRAKSNRLENLNRVLELQGDFVKLLENQVNESMVSDEFWGPLKYTAIRSVVMRDLAVEWIMGGYAGPSEPQILSEIKPETDLKCHLKRPSGLVGADTGSSTPPGGTSSGGGGGGGSSANLPDVPCSTGPAPVPYPVPTVG